MTYLLDTNILLHFIRDSPTKKRIVTDYAPLSSENRSVVSVVSIGEIKSIAIQNQWGKVKQGELEKLFTEFVVADINIDTVIQRYAEIDAFSQGKLPGKLLQLTSRNMGKNDLWIAATASVSNAALLTTDSDFDHLDGIFIKLVKIKPV